MLEVIGLITIITLGAVWEFTFPERNNEDEDGLIDYEGTKSILDLIPKKKKVKYLKSVPEIMEEVEGSHFGLRGNLRYHDGDLLVPRDKLYLCGYTTDEDWPQYLIKEVEEG